MNNEIFIRKEPCDFNELGLKDEVMPWEDCMRTDGKSNTYEWWYFDAEYDNGMKVIMIIYTKDRFDCIGKSKPTISIDIHFADGTSFYKVISTTEESIKESSKEYCNIEAMGCYAKYKNGIYEVYFIVENIEYRCILEPIAEMWRPFTGHFYFDDDKTDFFAWLVPVPSAKAIGYIKYKDTFLTLTGNGYHDHNWGNCNINKVIDNWYWARTITGAYSFIFYNLISSQNKETSVLALFKNGKLINKNDYSVKFEKEKPFINFISNKILHHKITLDKSIDNNNFKIQYIRSSDIIVFNLIDAMGFSLFQKVIKKIKKIIPTYLRSVGEIKIIINDNRIETTYFGEALLEQMRFNR